MLQVNHSQLFSNLPTGLATPPHALLSILRHLDVISDVTIEVLVPTRAATLTRQATQTGNPDRQPRQVTQTGNPDR
jgi:hypothetical protein